MADPNLEMLKIAVSQLGDLTQDLVFVGGCTVGRLITDVAASDARPTKDVDTIIKAATYAEYQSFAERLQKQGFAIDTREGAPICRWLKGDTVLDVMPLEEDALGFTNIWYRDALKTATTMEISSGVNIKVIAPPYFCATKLEAFRGRGNGDYLASYDLEDLIIVVDGRPELVDDIRSASDDVRSYIASYITTLLNDVDFRDALPGFLSPDEVSQARIGILLERLMEISKL
jgi:hypothetical protein